MTSLTVQETVTTTGINLGDGLVYIPGKGLFSNSSQNPQKVVKVPNPATDLATFSTTTLTNDGTFPASVGMAYSPARDKLYVCCGGYDTGTRWKFKIEQFDPDDMSHSTWLNVDFSDSSTDHAGPKTPNIIVDDGADVMYLLTHTDASLGPDCEIRKYNLSDASLAASRVLTGKRRGHPLVLNTGEGMLYFGGSQPFGGGAWAGKMDSALTTHSTVQLANSGAIVCDDMIDRGSYFWLQDELKQNPARIWRVKKSDLTFDAIDIDVGSTGVCDGFWLDTNTDKILIGIRDVLGAGKVVVFDPDLLVVTDTFTIGSSINSVNELIRVGASTLYIATFEADGKIARAALDIGGGGGGGAAVTDDAASEVGTYYGGG